MSILEQLKKNGIFTNTEQAVVDYILERPERVLHISLKDMAKESFSSEATIIRTCRKLGLDGFADLKISLAYELNSFLLKEGEIKVDIPIEKDYDDKKIAKTFLNLSYHALTNTYQMMDIRKLRKAADMIRRAEGVSIYGRGESLVIAEEIHIKLLNIGIRSSLDSINGVQEVRSRGRFHKEVALIISCYADSLQVKYIMDELLYSKTPVILLTGNHQSPLAQAATLPIFIETSETRYKMGAFATRISMQYVLDCIYGILFSMDYEKNLQSIQEFANRRGMRRYI